MPKYLIDIYKIIKGFYLEGGVAILVFVVCSFFESIPMEAYEMFFVNEINFSIESIAIRYILLLVLVPLFLHAYRLWREIRGKTKELKIEYSLNLLECEEYRIYIKRVDLSILLVFSSIIGLFLLIFALDSYSFYGMVCIFILSFWIGSALLSTHKADADMRDIVTRYHN